MPPTPPHSRFGAFTLRNRKERRQQAEEQKWADRAGPVETRHIEDQIDTPDTDKYYGDDSPEGRGNPL